MDHFDSLSQDKVDRILAAVKPTTCPLDPCPSWLIKASDERLWVPLQEIINKSLELGTFPKGLKEAVGDLPEGAKRGLAPC